MVLSTLRKGVEQSQEGVSDGKKTIMASTAWLRVCLALYLNRNLLLALQRRTHITELLCYFSHSDHIEKNSPLSPSASPDSLIGLLSTAQLPEPML